MLRPERQHDGLFVGRGLQLEAEPDAEALAQGQAERAVDAAAKRRVHDELHAAALVEESLETMRRVVGIAPSARAPVAM